MVVVLTQMWLLPALPTNHAVRLGQLPQLLRLRKVRLGIVAIMLIFIGQFAAYTYVTPFLVQVVAMSAKTISALLLAYGNRRQERARLADRHRPGARSVGAGAALLRRQPGRRHRPDRGLGPGLRRHADLGAKLDVQRHARP